MSKRDMRAKKLLLAVLLAMSMQSYYAEPTWAAEAGQPTGQTETVDGKGQSDGTTTPAADEAETSAPAEGEEAAAEGEDGANTDAAMPPVTYGVRAANAGTDEYGVMPAVVAPGGNPSTNAYTAGDASVSGSNLAVAIGYGANATSADFSVVLGASGEATAQNAVALGYNAKANHENSVAIGANSTTTAANQVSFGKREGFDEYNLPVWAVARSLVGIKDIDINGINFEGDIHDENVIIGGYMDVPSKYSVILGSGAVVNADYSVAIGNNAKVVYENSVAIGANSLAEAEYVVSFGNNDTSEFRTLVNVRGIEFAEENGYIFGMTNINGVEVAYKNNPSEGLKFGGNAIVGKENIPFSSTGFSVSDTGAITATSFTDGKATLTGGKLTGVTGINSTGAITTASLSSTGAITAASGTIGGITLNGGALDKVSSINGANFTLGRNSIAVGSYTTAEDYGIAFGASAHAKESSIALGMGVDAEGQSSIALGFNMAAYGAYSIAMGGDDTNSDANKSIAIGTGAAIESNRTHDENTGSIALGFYANASHENSVAIGMGSNATDDNQVNLGYYKLNGNYPDTSSTYYGRSLAGISSIDFIAAEDGTKGVITGLSSINGVAVSGSAAAGLTVSGVTLNGGKVNEVALGLKGGAGTDKDNVVVGSIDVTQMGTNSGGISRTGAGTDVSPYVTDVEGIKFSSDSVNFGGEWISTEEPHPDDPNYTVAKYTSNGKGALNGVTSINGMNFVYNYDNDRIIIGANVDVVGDTSVTAIGSESIASGTNATLVGAYATASGETSTVL